MKILAFLQNQWFKDPDRVREMYARSPHHRNDFIRGFLFMGCLTGRRLSTALGDDICQDHVIWEEISPEIGGYAASCFPADPEHIKTAIEKHQPTIILAFGKYAGEALAVYDSTHRVIRGPHPAARNNPMPRLCEIGKEIRGLLEAI